MKSFTSVKIQLLKNKEIKQKYDELGPEFLFIQSLIEKRLQKGMTQTDLAKKIGTKQSAISRLESGTYNPTLDFLKKVADALDMNLKVTLS